MKNLTFGLIAALVLLVQNAPIAKAEELRIEDSATTLSAELESKLVSSKSFTAAAKKGQQFYYPITCFSRNAYGYVYKAWGNAAYAYQTQAQAVGNCIYFSGYYAGCFATGCLQGTW